jgi:hypothetical protein
MSSIYTSEIFYNYPIPPDGVVFSSISASGIKAYISSNNILFEGNYSFDVVTITLRGIQTLPFPKPLASNIATVTFTFRNRTWILLDTNEGRKFFIANTPIYDTWNCIGVDLNNPRVRLI